MAQYTDVHFLPRLCARTSHWELCPEPQVGVAAMRAVGWPDPRGAGGGLPAGAHALTPPLTTEAIVLEPANVLYDETAHWRWLAQLLSHFGIHTHFEAFYCLWRHDYLPHVGVTAHEARDVVERFLASMGLRPGQRGEILAAFVPRWTAWLNRPRPLPKTAGAVAQLSHAGMRLAVWARHAFEKQLLPRQLACLGVGGYLEDVSAIHHAAPGQLDAATCRAIEQALQVTAGQVTLVTCDPWSACAVAELGWTAVVCSDLPKPMELPHIARLEHLHQIITPSSLSRAA